MVQFALTGIEKHWNIPDEISTEKGNYRVYIKPVLSETHAAPSLTLQVQMKNSADRSVNASCVCGFVGRVAGNIGRNSSGLLDTTRVWYLQGYLGFRAKDYFIMTAAHEAGHSVLASYAYKSTGANNYSWVHKGSSKGLLSGYAIPEVGEKGYEKEPFISADLMKYYSPDYRIEIQMYSSSEYDIKSLLWLSRLTVGEY